MLQEVLYETCVDIHKAYDVLDRGRALEILEGSMVVPQVCRLLTRYWYWETMVEMVSGYYGDPFQGFWGVTQGVPLSPKILNAVVDVIICY